MSDPTRFGDTVSGDVAGPCADPTGGPVAGSRRLPEAVFYLGMLRPFPVKALHEALYFVSVDGLQIEQALNKLLVEPPSRIEQWTWALDQIDTLLWSLHERTEEARSQIAGFHDTADAEARRAETAMRWITAGLDQP